MKQKIKDAIEAGHIYFNMTQRNTGRKEIGEALSTFKERMSLLTKREQGEILETFGFDWELIEQPIINE